MMIRFQTFEQYHGRKQIGSTRIRVHNLLKFWDEADLYKYGEMADVMIFQKVYCTYDYKLPKTYPGITILDCCDLDWNDTPDIHIKETIDAVDAVAVPTKNLQKLLQQMTDTPIKLIKDRFIIEDFPPQKIHRGRLRSVVWFGYAHNADVLKFALPSLEKRGLKLTVISNQDPFLGKLNDDYTFKKYNQETIYSEMQKHDLCILPKGFRPQDRYKSENRTVIAQLCGLPVAETAEDLDNLVEGSARNKAVNNVYDKLKLEYDVRKSVKEYKELIEGIKNERL